MSRPAAADALPPSARALALLVAATPGVHDAQPGVLHQLLELAHRYAGQVLQDAQVYAEHAGRGGRVDMPDVALAVQARVGWEFGGRVPKDYIHALAAQTNGVPLPPVPEVFGVRLPPPAECLTAVDFDLVPTRPPPDVKLYDEEIEEIEESDEDEDEEPVFDEPAPPAEDVYMRASEPAPVSAFGTPEPRPPLSQEDEDEDDDDGLFAGGDDEDEPMEPAAPEPVAVQRKLVEDDDYD